MGLTIYLSRPSLTVGSLFSGIGGFELGLERTGGFITKWQVEIDPYCTRILQQHWPNAQRFDDIRLFKPPCAVDVLCGGFPCQDISAQGKKAGIEKGAQSSLWFEYVRIIRIIRPKYIIIENVHRLLSDGISTVLGTLSECGYDAEWETFRACQFGLPHTRKRVFIVAYPSSQRFERGQPGGAPKVFLTPVCDLSKRRAEDVLPTPVFCRSSDGIPNRTHRLKALGNSIIPDIAELIGRNILAADMEKN